ncbi:ABC transporter ATP-binding protein [Pseudomonas sp. S75]|uniref:ABC transporter ATP-binding protein n=1 Tax=unclassified Pseudomonas TaxID=196821 RepID=UPI0019078005|nr:MULTISPECIES: ABC transporter ATP-binding protein [unclassified Pseudomonas]MBJ9978168.1 ABC transporter ATP-binding protein [Pseudomonas sp. S30]MBK0155999.1 ABC transporter ATP-binding protein [Pseudomonas sp. S75]
MNSLASESLYLGYAGRAIIEGLDLTLPRGQVSVLIGSNGCGKSTLLKSFARLLRPTAGKVLLNGQDIQRKPTAQVARELAILPQMPVAPEGISVRQLVSLGRYPYQSWMRQWSADDEAAVARALQRTDLQALAARPVDELSGGQRQRAWIAMALAQETELLLLDEPTTFLDLAHQIEVLDLLRELNRREGKTVVMVLHDLNLASRYADHMVAVHDRRVCAQGRPAQILDQALVKQVFGLECRIIADPFFGTPLCIPFGRDIAP